MTFTTPLYQRFWRFAAVDSGCWMWTGHRTHQGYGEISRGARGQGSVLAHRLSYEIHKGPIPDGLHVDHLCRNTSCVNPDHLEAVTPQENTVRHQLSRTLCKNGHERHGIGRCKPCHALHQRRHIARRRAA